MSTLSERPDLDFEKKQAKALLKACRDGDSTAIARMQAHLERLKSPDAAAPTLADAQFVIARERGFDSWPKLKAHIEGLRPLDEHVVPFFSAVRNGKLTLARRILEQHPALTSHSFHVACAAADVKVAAEWLARDPSVVKSFALPQAQVLPLVVACVSQMHKLGPQVAAASTQCVKLLLDHGADPNTTFTEGDAKLPVLYYACIANNLGAVRLLLERGAEVNDGESIHHSAELNHRECMELLLSHGADISMRHPHWKKTVLFFLAEINAQPAGVEWLLEHGADPSVRSLELDETPLHRTAANGYLKLADLLIRHGADPDARRADGRTSYALAVRGGHTEMATRLREAGAQAESLSSVDAFLAAVTRGDEAAARAMLDASPALLERLTPEDRRLLINIASDNRLDAVRVMLALGFDAGFQDHEAGTALHAAAWKGLVDMSKLLISKGAPVGLRDPMWNATPLGFVLHGSEHCRSADPEYCEIIDALVAAGAEIEPPTHQSYGSAGVKAHLKRLLAEKGAG
jgi:ankyrin repeat protein